MLHLIGWGNGKLVKAPILCNTTSTTALRELNLDVDDSGYDKRIGKINLDLIIGYYPTEDYKHTIVAYSGTEIEVCLTFVEFDKLNKD